MEVDGSLTERSSDISVELKGAFDDWSNQFLDGALELAEMLVQERAVNSVQGRGVGELNSEDPEPSLKAGVDKEGTS
jgi:hypothetical protein